MNLLLAKMAKRVGIRTDTKEFGYQGGVDAIAFVSPEVRVPLDGLRLCAILDCAEDEGQTHDVVVQVAWGGVPDSPQNEPGARFYPRGDMGRFWYPINLGLGEFSVPYRADAEFQFLADGTLVGSLPFTMRALKDRVTITFLKWDQERQGATDGATYLSARFLFELADDGGFAGLHWVRVTQPPGRNFAEDPLEIELERGYERLSASYEFKVRVQACYDRYAKGLFGGSLPAGVQFTNNWIQFEPSVVECSLPTMGGGGW